MAPPPMPYDRATQQRRAARAEKDLGLLGRVNPLALEEFAALEERYRFLSTQLEDLKNTRRDLLTVVREVDDKILEVFTEAYTDVAREFETVFATLFPGGEGRLVLTDPSDMLTTGIEVEARPPGKKVKRLSLLSGGERSLTAMALLVAIFRARPSPFYVLDEIEAALDDVNLRRLILLMEELRDHVAADRHHPPEADDGGRGRAVRRGHARRRHHHGDLPAPAGGRARPAPRSGRLLTPVPPVRRRRVDPAATAADPARAERRDRVVPDTRAPGGTRAAARVTGWSVVTTRPCGSSSRSSWRYS